MHHVAPLRNSPILDERRRYVRHKPASIVYVALGPGNGGILVNLSAGGLFLQAVAKLNGETELNLNFRLQGTEQAIEATGCVAWLGTTQKEAGISFKDIAADTEQQIADWIASQEAPVPNTQPELKLRPTPATRDEALRLPIQASVPVSFPSEKLEHAPSDRVSRILREPPPEPPQPDLRSAPDPAPLPVSRSSAAGFRAPGDEDRFGSLPDEQPELPPKHFKLQLESKAPALIPGEILPRDCLLPDPILPTRQVTAAITAEPMAPPVSDSLASNTIQRRKLAIAVAACMLGILILIVAVASLNGPPSPSEQPVQYVRPPATVPEPVSASQKRPAQRPHPKAAAGAVSQGDSATVADDDAPLMGPAVRIAVPVHEDGFIGHLRSLLGMDVTTILDPSAAAVHVWTIQHSGFYYCADSPNFKTLLPGALMTQGEALQSGYQPKLGTYCQ